MQVWKSGLGTDCFLPQSVGQKRYRFPILKCGFGAPEWPNSRCRCWTREPTGTMSRKTSHRVCWPFVTALEKEALPVFHTARVFLSIPWAMEGTPIEITDLASNSECDRNSPFISEEWNEDVRCWSHPAVLNTCEDYTHACHLSHWMNRNFWESTSSLVFKSVRTPVVRYFWNCVHDTNL